MPPLIAACLPRSLHPASRMLLETFLEAPISERDFRWGFHPANSDYLSMTECVLRALVEPAPRRN